MIKLTLDSDLLRFRTTHEGEIMDLTERVQTIVEKGRIRSGVAFVFVQGSTAALTTLEYEPGLVVDLPKILEQLVPKEATYEHEQQLHDGNGHSHIRAALIGPDVSIPFENQKLQLSTWQQIVFVELDTRPRDRSVIVKLMGE